MPIVGLLAQAWFCGQMDLDFLWDPDFHFLWNPWFWVFVLGHIFPHYFGYLLLLLYDAVCSACLVLAEFILQHGLDHRNIA